jgi:hypothetical protein
MSSDKGQVVIGVGLDGVYQLIRERQPLPSRSGSAGELQ